MISGTVKRVENKVLIFVDNNRQLEKYHGKEIVIKVDNEYFFVKVIRYANRYVIYVPSSEDREGLLRKKEINFEILNVLEHRDVETY